jgi:hypothetical protein
VDPRGGELDRPRPRAVDADPGVPLARRQRGVDRQAGNAWASRSCRRLPVASATTRARKRASAPPTGRDGSAIPASACPATAFMNCARAGVKRS